MGACPLVGRRTAFDEGCTGWVDRKARARFIQQPKASEPTKISHHYVPHELTIERQAVEDISHGGRFRSFTAGLTSVYGTTWVDSFTLPHDILPFRYVRGDQLIAFEGYLTGVETVEEIRPDGRVIQRFKAEFVGQGEPLFIYPFHGGDIEQAVSQAFAAKEDQRRQAEDRLKADHAAWAAAHPTDDDDYSPDWLTD